MILRKPTDVNVNKAGDYELVYSVEDSAGNMAKVSRTVKVKEKEVVTKPDGQKPTPNNGGNQGTNGSGGSLPDTATNQYNLMLSGALVALLGVLMFLVSLKRRFV